MMATNVADGVEVASAAEGWRLMPPKESEMSEREVGLVERGSVEEMLRGRESAPWAELFGRACEALRPARESEDAGESEVEHG